MTEPARIVFIGDSITDCGRDRTDPTSLGDGYVSLVAADLAARQSPATVVNLGIGGNRVVDLEVRWRTELLPSAPTALTVFVGVNDMWRRFDSDDPTSARRFEDTYRRILQEAVAAARPRLILMEPFFLPVRPEQSGWLEDLDPKRAAVARLADEFAAAFVPLHTVMTDAAGSRPEAIAPDGVHPTPTGHRIIADAWLAAFDH